MILTVKRKTIIEVAMGRSSIDALAKTHGLLVTRSDNNILLIENDDILDTRYDVLIVQHAVDWVEYDIITKEDYAANYTAL